MKIYRTVRTAMTALRRHPLRAALTALGIVIGVGAVIAMMEIGTGSSAALQESLSSMGANVLMILPGTAASGGITFGSGSQMSLTPEDCEAIARECPSVGYASPVVRGSAQVIYGERNWIPSSIHGVSPDYLNIQNWTDLAEGAPFTDRDVLAANKVCLLGQTVARELFPGESPVGERIRIKNVLFRVVGVLSSKGSNMMGMDQDDVLLAPWTSVEYYIAGRSSQGSGASSASTSSSSTGGFYPRTAAELYPERSEDQTKDNPMLVSFPSIDRIIASAHGAEEIPGAIQEITELLRERHRIRQGEADDFNIRNMTEMRNTLASTTSLMSNLLLSVAMISLLVGGVGIMNIMLVSVTERTREIGLRMAVGARPRDILRQFLVESLVLCLVGGAAGILLGHGGSYLVRLFLRWPVQTSQAAIVLAVLVSGCVGVAFGFYPAWKASRLDPIEALRYE